MKVISPRLFLQVQTYRPKTPTGFIPSFCCDLLPVKTLLFLVLFSFWSAACGTSFAGAPSFSTTSFDDNWEFLRVDSSAAPTNAYDQPEEDLMQAQQDLAAKEWAKATLPHTDFIEPKDIIHSWQGISWYRKTFTLPAQDRGKRITLEIGGAMQIADIWVNSKYLMRHLGGYMGFTVDLTDVANYGGDNTIVIRLDNRPDPLVPPGKPLDQLDFCYYSGLYRDVDLHVSNPLHITDAVEANQAAGGGVFVTYADVSPQSATVNIKTQVKLETTGTPSSGCEVHQELFDLAGHLVAKAAPVPVNLQPGDVQEIEQSVGVVNPRLWSPDHPNLYLLKTQIVQGGAVLDENTNRIGIRTFTVSPEAGIEINGQPVRLMGTNRHMEYPYIGNAVSADAQYRDIWLIKNAGFNIVRLCHYPQDPSVYAACDRLGVLAIDCTPGWQYYNNDGRFRDNALTNIREMIRRDRNHPSIVFWELSLNESSPAAGFYQKSQAVAREEFPGGLTSGDNGGPWDVIYPSWYKGRFVFSNPTATYYAREYGDWEFGGNNSTSRKTRGDGEQALLQQAWNFASTHNTNAGNRPPLCGDGTWVMFDYNRGGNRPTERSGMADITRVPKWVYSFYQSQRDPAGTSIGAGLEAGPMVFIASDWTPHPPDPGKVVVFSNCDEVELFVNGQSVARQRPDSGPAIDPHQKNSLWNGGNSQHLIHPAFTFTHVAYAPGELKAIGYFQGHASAQQSVFTAGDPAALKVEAAVNDRPLSANGTDVLFVHARVMDKDGHFCPEAQNPLRFTVTGPAQIVGPAIMNAEAGIGSILLQATDQPGTITVQVSSAGLSEGVATIESGAVSRTGTGSGNE